MMPNLSLKVEKQRDEILSSSLETGPSCIHSQMDKIRQTADFLQLYFSPLHWTFLPSMWLSSRVVQREDTRNPPFQFQWSLTHASRRELLQLYVTHGQKVRRGSTKLRTLIAKNSRSASTLARKEANQVFGREKCKLFPYGGLEGNIIKQEDLSHLQGVLKKFANYFFSRSWDTLY